MAKKRKEPSVTDEGTQPTLEKEKKFTKLINRFDKTLDKLGELLPNFQNEKHIDALFRFAKVGKKVNAVVENELHKIYPEISEEAGMWFNEKSNNDGKKYLAVHYDNSIDKKPSEIGKIPKTGTIALGPANLLEEGKPPKPRRLRNEKKDDGRDGGNSR